jgi:5-hydroxyisourate hydrolase
MSHISTHILDTALGKPADGVVIRLEQLTASGWQVVREATTNPDGRISSMAEESLAPGRYRLTADIGQWFAQTGRETLYPSAQIDVTLPRSGGHYHLPFLIAPWGWSTYRGS